MLKTIIAAILTFIGLKIGTPVYHVAKVAIKIIFWGVAILLFLKCLIPILTWYLDTLKEIVSPFFPKGVFSEFERLFIIWLFALIIWGIFGDHRCRKCKE